MGRPRQDVEPIGNAQGERGDRAFIRVNVRVAFAGDAQQSTTLVRIDLEVLCCRQACRPPSEFWEVAGSKLKRPIGAGALPFGFDLRLAATGAKRHCFAIDNASDRQQVLRRRNSCLPPILYPRFDHQNPDA